MIHNSRKLQKPQKNCEVTVIYFIAKYLMYINKNAYISGTPTFFIFSNFFHLKLMFKIKMYF